MSSLGRKLLGSYFLVCIPPVAATATLSAVIASQQVHADLEERVTAGARGAELAVGTSHDGVRARTSAAARSPGLQRALAANQRMAVLRFAEQSIPLIGVDRATVIDSKGRVIARGHAPARYGDLFDSDATDTRSVSEEGTLVVESSEGGVGAEITFPVISQSGQPLGALRVLKAFDYRTLSELKRQFGLDFTIWDADRLQATTLRSAEAIEEALRARLTNLGSSTVHRTDNYYFARAALSGAADHRSILLVSVGLDAAASLTRRLTLLYAGIALVMLALVVAGSILSARRITRPILRLAGAAEDATRGDLAVPIEVYGKDEIGELASAFRTMLARRREAEEELRRIQSDLEARVIERTEALRRSEEHLRQARQLEALGRLAGGIAHDFNNVLTAIGGNAELMELVLESAGETEATESLRDGISQVQKATVHAAGLVRQLMAFSRHQNEEAVVVDLGHVTHDLEKMLRQLCTEDVSLRISAAPDLRQMRADPVHIGQILVNLVVNAQDALPDGGTIEVRLSNVEQQHEELVSAGKLEPGHYLCLEVADDGVGMDEETAQRLFEPFFTTKAPGKGTGMGLATVHGLVTRAQGQIDVSAGAGGGTRFRIYFPAVEAERAAARVDKSAPPPGGCEAILLCEDEPGVRDLAANILRSGGYDVRVAGSGAEALRLAEQPPAIDLLVTDVVMPEMNGAELADRLRERIHDVKVLYVSGYTASVISSRADLNDGDQLLLKPFTRNQLLERVRKALEIERADVR